MASENTAAHVFGAAAADPAVREVGTAAAKDPRAQQAAREAVSQPGVQAAAWNAARNAASQGAQHAQAGFIEVRSYIRESHFSLQILCFCAALALLISSVLGMLNVFNAVFNPFQYLHAFWNCVFAAIIIVMDGKSQWFGTMQTQLFSSASFLASHGGRALFYFYVGSKNLLVLPDAFLWKIVYVCIGSALCLISAIMLVSHCGCQSSKWQQHQEDEPRV